MTNDEKHKLINSAVQTIHGEVWHVTISCDMGREHRWAVERRWGNRDVWIGHGPTLEVALDVAAKSYEHLLRVYASEAMRIASKLSSDVSAPTETSDA